MVSSSTRGSNPAHFIIKKRIEVTFDVTCVISLLTILPFQGLIEREYMKRSDHDRKLYIYLVVSGG